MTLREEYFYILSRIENIVDDPALTFETKSDVIRAYMDGLFHIKIEEIKRERSKE